MRKVKRKCLSSKCQKCKTHVREAGEHRQVPEEDELSLYGVSDLDDQIDRPVDTPHITNAKGARINEKVEDRDEDDLIKYTENDFNSVEQTEEPIGNIFAKIINNVIRTPINKEKEDSKVARLYIKGSRSNLQSY